MKTSAAVVAYVADVDAIDDRGPWGSLGWVLGEPKYNTLVNWHVS